MLQEKNRLKKKRDIEIVLENGKFLGGALVTMKYWKIVPEKYPKRGYTVDDLKIGFVVGLKVSKKAVIRNRLKRQMREVIRLYVKENTIPLGFMILLFAKKEMIDQSYDLIAKDIEVLLQRARLLQK